MKQKLTYKNNKLIEDHRYKIELINAHLKKYNRIYLRKDRYSKYFYSFIYMASVLHNLNMYNKIICS